MRKAGINDFMSQTAVSKSTKNNAGINVSHTPVAVTAVSTCVCFDKSRSKTTT